VIRGDFTWLDETGTTLVRDEAGKLRWWPFAGQLANSSLSSGLSAVGLASVSCDNLSLVLPSEHDEVSQALASLRGQERRTRAGRLQEALRQLKFAECLSFEPRAPKSRPKASGSRERRCRSDRTFASRRSRPDRVAVQRGRDSGSGACLRRSRYTARRVDVSLGTG
jgi:hypothetical protein